jgi:hypothetical protein
MANNRRDKGGYTKQLGRFKINRKDILIIEKILWEYADIVEMSNTGATKPPDGRRHMPRKTVDRYISIDGNRYDSIKVRGVSKRHFKTRNIEIAAWPGIKVTFTPLRSEIYGQTNYATGNELYKMREVISSVESYIDSRPRSLLNDILIRKAVMKNSDLLR